MTNVLKQNRITRYFKEVRAEITKVTWPSRQEVVRLSAIVIAVLLITSAFMAILDYVFSRLMQVIINLGAGL
jgi:preprotein translocase subunit SecE